MSWELILVTYKPGVVHLWPEQSPTAVGATWEDPRTILLQNQKISVGSSALLSVSGAFYERKHDSLVISLYDGSFHVIAGLSSDPSYVTTNSLLGISTESISRTARTLFTRAEARQTQKADMNCMSGMMSYDESSTVVWAHECVDLPFPIPLDLIIQRRSCRPTDFSYKHDAKHNVMFVMAQLWDHVTDAGVADDLRTILSRSRAGEFSICRMMNILIIVSARSATGDAPIYLLRPIFLHVARTKAFGALRQKILQVLQEFTPDDSAAMAVNTMTVPVGPVSRLDFRNSLARHLFGWDYILAMRMKLAVADLCWV